MANLLNIGVLRNSPDLINKKEIRIWYGFGSIVPDYLLSLTIESDGLIKGTMYIYYPSDLSYMDKENALEFRSLYKSLCRNSVIGEESEACEVVFPKEPDWQHFYRNIVKHGLLDLPDESLLPRPEIHVHDGTSMVVELKESDRYRSFGYSNPLFRRDNEGRAASTIMSEFAEIRNTIYN